MIFPPEHLVRIAGPEIAHLKGFWDVESANMHQIPLPSVWPFEEGRGTTEAGKTALADCAPAPLGAPPHPNTEMG